MCTCVCVSEGGCARVCVSEWGCTRVCESEGGCARVCDSEGGCARVCVSECVCDETSFFGHLLVIINQSYEHVQLQPSILPVPLNSVFIAVLPL